ncbi:phospholipid scramblase 1 [Lunasporangiospora selenospora]|uniref:Phospholipid scramblase 1 n=1 Tax=Lunasporangiospora selenospora TaxID=979761 RepID=A0A9P6FRL2_9FUNG|nr:phospholipid scramblase 1 [Lunasporangiospora selenospora]
MTQSFSEQETLELKESFDAFDYNKDGTISRRELHSLLHIVGHKLNGPQFDNLLTEYDTDKNGDICFDEFIQLAQVLIKNKVVNKA